MANNSLRPSIRILSAIHHSNNKEERDSIKSSRRSFPLLRQFVPKNNKQKNNDQILEKNEHIFTINAKRNRTVPAIDDDYPVS